MTRDSSEYRESPTDLSLISRREKIFLSQLRNGHSASILDLLSSSCRSTVHPGKSTLCSLRASAGGWSGLAGVKSGSARKL